MTSSLNNPEMNEMCFSAFFNFFSSEKKMDSKVWNVLATKLSELLIQLKKKKKAFVPSNNDRDVLEMWTKEPEIRCFRRRKNRNWPSPKPSVAECQIRKERFICCHPNIFFLGYSGLPQKVCLRNVFQWTSHCSSWEDLAMFVSKQKRKWISSQQVEQVRRKRSYFCAPRNH